MSDDHAAPGPRGQGSTAAPDDPWAAFGRLYDASPSPLHVQLREVWTYRELLGFLLWRDLRVRYRQTVLGLLWVLLQPATITVLFTLLFGRLAGLSSRLSGGAPYPVFVYAGMLPFALFTGGLGRAAGSLVGNGYLISRIWFPRLLLPLEGVLVGVPDALLSSLLLATLMVWFGQATVVTVLLCPAFLCLALLAALGLGMCLASVMVYLRDLRQTLPFLTMILLFVSPLAWPVELLSPSLATWAALNPLVGAMEGFRWALYGAPLDGVRLAISSGVTLLLLLAGFTLFGRVERIAADLV